MASYNTLKSRSKVPKKNERTLPILTRPCFWAVNNDLFKKTAFMPPARRFKRKTPLLAQKQRKSRDDRTPDIRNVRFFEAAEKIKDTLHLSLSQVNISIYIVFKMVTSLFFVSPQKNNVNKGLMNRMFFVGIHF